MAKTVEQQVLEKLDQILRVLSLQVGADKSITERVQLLKVAGIDNRTIAKVLKTTEATVRTLAAAGRQRAIPGGRRAPRKKRRKS